MYSKKMSELHKKNIETTEVLKERNEECEKTINALNQKDVQISLHFTYYFSCSTISFYFFSFLEGSSETERRIKSCYSGVEKGEEKETLHLKSDND